jgi:hypothetical protein
MAQAAVAHRTENPDETHRHTLVLLSAASQRQEGAIELAPNLKGGAANEVVGKLLSEGMMEEIPTRARSGAVGRLSTAAAACASDRGPLI